MTLPNFLLLGANKAGTTSLASYLGQHPQVYMSPVKEPGFFAIQDHDPASQAALGSTFTLDTYTALFDEVTTERAVGEASTAYLGSAEAPAAIRRLVPDARLLAVLRNPVDRAFSNYQMQLSRGREPLGFGDAIAAELNGEAPPPGVRERRYVRLGFYGRYLARYYETFPAAQLRVVLYDDYRRDPGAVLADLFRFLGVDDSFVADTSVERNVSYVPKSKALHGLLGGGGRLRPALSPLVPSGAKARVAGYLARRNRRPVDFPADVRHQLVELYRSDILELQDLLGRDLSAWLC
ncbi:MAG TPA: sulfotransferase [Acidimicrobiales bacterium]|nr:sulfotransferase [Acidimicrobiales bacterium]